MKAVVMKEFGDPNVLTYEDIDTPKPRMGHVLVRILASGVNRLDHYIREGSIVRDLRFPHVLGADASGEVADIGPGVEAIKKGERVIVVPGYPTSKGEIGIKPAVIAPSFALPGLHIRGTYAQYIEVPEYAVVKDDTGLAPEEASTLPVVLATAVHSVSKVGGVKEGQNVNAGQKIATMGSSGASSVRLHFEIRYQGKSVNPKRYLP